MLAEDDEAIIQRGLREGDNDAAIARYIDALLRHSPPPPQTREQVRGDVRSMLKELGWTPVDEREPDERPCETKPNEATENPPRPATTCQNLPHSASVGAHAGCETKPIRDAPQRLPNARPLTPRQRLAARMIAAGRRYTDVAAALDLDRHTVGGWMKRPTFAAEVERLLGR